MTQPHELKQDLPMEIPDGLMSTTTKVWDILLAAYQGKLDIVKAMVAECPEMVYAQYNYTPPIHFAVREGHADMVNYLLERGALSPGYRIYPFQDPLLVLANDRGFTAIAASLQHYIDTASMHRFKKDCGAISFLRSETEQEFENAVDKEDIEAVSILLEKFPGIAHDPNYFWAEGILTMPAKKGNIALMELLLAHGARFPQVSKWPQFYYFEKYDSARFILEHGMSANHKTWQEVTILHDMAQKGNLAMAELLLQHGAGLEPIDDDYRSTPLGMAARWGHVEMVKYLLQAGADPSNSGAEWATPMAWARKKGHEKIIELLSKAGAR